MRNLSTVLVVAEWRAGVVAAAAVEAGVGTEFAELAGNRRGWMQMCSQ